jgi:phospholipase C
MHSHFRLGTMAITGALGLGVAMAGGFVGCSNSGNGNGNGAGVTAQDDGGTIQLALTAGGSTFNSFTYTINGPASFTKSGTINVASSTSLTATIGGIPAGSGFTITLMGTSVDGATSCMGSATFSVTARQTTPVMVALDCHQQPRTGSISLTGTLNICPQIQSISSNPGQLTGGASSAITSTATDADNGPMPLSYSWTTNLGTLTNQNTANPTFTCTAIGTATLTLTVSDGDPMTSCADTGSVQVVCSGHVDNAAEVATKTKIKHLVVIFGENISFDHYFGTYPVSQNLSGETPFVGDPATPGVNGLTRPLDPTNMFNPLVGVDLVHNNPNLTAAGNGAGASNPFRLSASAAWTNSQGHNYKPEQQADDNGLMDLFPQFTGNAGPPPGAPPIATTKGLVMAYFDGNTVPAFWNWAQQYSLNDNSFGTTFGPSTPGAINLISGQTNGFATTNKPGGSFSASHAVADGNGGFTLIGDTDPIGDVCSAASDQNSMAGKNIGDLLSAQGISWGFFEGGFDLTITNADGSTGCARKTAQTVPGATGISVDYIPHHQPFQYYASTANLTHARPSSLAAIGKSLETDGITPEPANHQYDSHDFFDALTAGNLPSVSYLKAPAFQDGHPGYSNPIDEQNFAKQVVTAVQGSQEWASTAVVYLYDDSDGWYDHVMPPIVNPSTSVADAINGINTTTGVGTCNHGLQQGTATPATALLGNDGNPAQGRCGYGTRQPLLVISPYAKKNYVDHTLTDQTSVLKFVEDNWLAGQRIQTGGSFDTIAGTIENMLSF